MHRADAAHQDAIQQASRLAPDGLRDLDPAEHLHREAAEVVIRCLWFIVSGRSTCRTNRACPAWAVSGSPSSTRPPPCRRRELGACPRCLCRRGRRRCGSSPSTPPYSSPRDPATCASARIKICFPPYVHTVVA